MTEKKWSKWPWVAIDPYGDGGPEIDIMSANAVMLASIGDSNAPIEEDMANVPLIAAAPELYDALESAVNDIERWLAANPQVMPGSWSHQILTAGKQALAKATGERAA